MLVSQRYFRGNLFLLRCVPSDVVRWKSPAHGTGAGSPELGQRGAAFQEGRTRCPCGDRLSKPPLSAVCKASAVPELPQPPVPLELDLPRQIFITLLLFLALSSACPPSPRWGTPALNPPFCPGVKPSLQLLPELLHG